MDKNEKETIQHPAFGQISVSRVHSTGTNFYGSNLKHNNYIAIEIRGSEIQRDLGNDRHFPTSNKMSIRLTSVQFAELLTNMNTTGVPCTIELDYGRVEPLPEIEDRKHFIHRKFRDRMKAFESTLRDNQEIVKKLTAKKTLSKEDQHTLNWAVDKISQEVTQNIPFFMQVFQESSDEIVVEAKAEMEAAIQHKITSLGLRAIAEENRQLSDGKEDNNG